MPFTRTAGNFRIFGRILYYRFGDFLYYTEREGYRKFIKIGKLVLGYYPKNWTERNKMPTDLEKAEQFFQELHIPFRRFDTTASVQLEISPEVLWCGAYELTFLFTGEGKFAVIKPREV